MSKIKDKYKEWKATKYTKFRNQSNDSYLQTEKEAKEVSRIYNNDEKLQKFAYEFKKPWHQKAIVKSKKINIVLTLVLSGLFLILIAFYASLINCIWINPAGITPEDCKSTSYQIWLLNFIYTTIIASVNSIYFISQFIIKHFRNKKFNNSPNYVYRFNDNLIVTIVLLVFTSTYFICFSPFTFIPVLLIQIIKYNSTTYVILLIITFILDVLAFITYLMYIANTIMCFAINPKFNFNLLTNNSAPNTVTPSKSLPSSSSSN